MNVTSILWMPYVLPEYRDKRGPAVTFRVAICGKGSYRTGRGKRHSTR